MVPMTDLDGEIAKLVDLPSAALKLRWEDLYGAPPPKRLGRDLIIRAVAYKMQEQALGGLKLGHRRRLKQLAIELHANGEIAITSRPRIKPGTRLIREWQGEVHEVSVTEDGFRWRGECYESLSPIARAITGTRWSGPAFFGLKQRSSQAEMTGG